MFGRRSTKGRDMKKVRKPIDFDHEIYIYRNKVVFNLGRPETMWTLHGIKELHAWLTKVIIYLESK